MFSSVRAGVIVLCAMASACTPSPPPPTRPMVRFTIMPGGGSYTLANALVREYRARFPSLQFEVRERSALTNINTLARGEAEFAFAYADVAYTTYAEEMRRGRSTEIRGVAALQLAPIHLVVGRHVRAKSIRDLTGLRVGIGQPMSSTQFEAETLLDSYRVDRSRLRLESLTFDQAAERLSQGTLDAFFATATYPAESVRRALTDGAVLLPLDDPVIDALRRESVFLNPTVIPAGTYPKQAVAVHTLGVRNMLVCRRDLDEGLVYDLTRQFFEALPSLFFERDSLRLVDLQQAPATPIPLHPGAARYYRERELER